MEGRQVRMAGQAVLARAGLVEQLAIGRAVGAMTGQAALALVRMVGKDEGAAKLLVAVRAFAGPNWVRA